MEPLLFIPNLVNSLFTNKRISSLKNDLNSVIIDIDIINGKIKEIQQQDKKENHVNSILTIKIIEKMCNEAKYGYLHEVVVEKIDIEKICWDNNINMSSVVTNSAIFELTDSGLITIYPNDIGYYTEISPTDIFYFLTDPIFMGWVPENDALTITHEMVRKGEQDNYPEKIVKDNKWNIRRVNSFLKYMEYNDYAELSTPYGGSKFVSDEIKLKAKAYHLVNSTVE